MKKLFLLLTLFCSSSFAGIFSDKTMIYSVMDLDKNASIESQNLSSPHSMASLTKLMTAFVLIKNHPNLNTCSAKITEEERDELKKTKTRLEKNESITCKKLLQAMLIVSDNWAASALSKTIPNVTQQKFVQMMNVQALEWGMKDTLYKDPSGLSPDNISSARDLSILMKNVVKEKLITDFSSQKDMVLLESTGSFLILRNSNKLIREMHYGALLSKTGYISESGYNLMFVPDKKCNNKQLGIIIMGAKSSSKRASFSQKLLNKYNCPVSVEKN